MYENIIFKKVIGFISTVAIAFTAVGYTSVYAEENIEDDILEFETLNEYIEFSIPRHLYAQSVIIDGPLSYSQPVVLYNFSNNSVIGSEIFVFENNHIIGKMEIYDNENGYTSLFDTYIPDTVYSAYLNGDEIAMGYFEDSLMMYSDSYGFVYIDGFENSDLPQYSPEELNKITLSGETPSDFAVAYSIATVKLNVKHVPNGDMYDIYGECWAACLAMKLNYQMGMNLDADSVTLVCKNNPNLQIPGHDQEENTVHPDIIAMYSHYNYNVTYKGSALTAGNVYSILRENKPLVMSINNNATPEAYGYAMVIKGIVLDSSFSTYIIDNPNKPGEVTLLLTGNPSQLQSSISYTDGSFYYDNWRGTYY